MTDTNATDEPVLERITHHVLDPGVEAMSGRYALMKLPADAVSPTDYRVTNFFQDEATAWEQAQLAVAGPEPRAAMAWVLDVRGALVQSEQDHLSHGVNAEGDAAPDQIRIPMAHAEDRDE